MKEIGGYMAFETYHGMAFHHGLIALNTARSGLKYILKTKKYSKVYLPVYLCDCIYKMLEQLHIDYEFYQINQKWLPLFDQELKNNECLFIVNYFGQLSNETLLALKKKYKHIIVDNTQSFFQAPIPYIDTLYNCRKYFGVSDGSYLSMKEASKESLKPDVSYDRFEYLIGRYECGASPFYSTFAAADDSLMEKDLMGMSKLTHNIMRSLDYGKIETIRRKNFSYLHQELFKQNELQDLIEGTFMYPFMCPHAESLRAKLIAKQIYIPILWPNVLEEAPKDSYDYHLARMILPLPIDHRYGESEMRFIVEQIKENL